jgi:hypothetical protein
MQRGGKRVGAGRKTGSTGISGEVARMLREKITTEDFELAIKTLRRAMKSKKNLKVASDASMFIIEQKIGKAPQSINMEHSGEVKILKDNI